MDANDFPENPSKKVMEKIIQQYMDSVDASENDELLSVPEISELLKVTPQQVRNLINSNQLKSIKLSERGTRVKKSDFEVFLKSR